LTTKKFAARPAAMALLRNVRLLSRSPAALALALAAVDVALLRTKTGEVELRYKRKVMRFLGF